MKQLKYKFNLDCEIDIFVPSTIGGSYVDNKEQVKNVVTQLTTIFGGATASKAGVGWLVHGGKMEVEKPTIVYSFCNSTLLNDNIIKVLEICESLKNEMKQNFIPLGINGEVKFV